MPDPWRPAFEVLDERWSAEHKRQRASPGGVRETFFRAGFEAALAPLGDCELCSEPVNRNQAHMGVERGSKVIYIHSRCHARHMRPTGTW